MKNSTDSDLEPQPAGNQEAALIDRFLNENDFSQNTQRAFAQDLEKFSHWFTQANKEPFRINRVTTGDVSTFKDHLRRDQQLAVSTVNRALVTVRRFFSWLIEEGHLTSNPAKKVKELKRQQRQRDSKEHRPESCCVRLNCGATSEPTPFFPCSCSRDVVLETWPHWNSVT